MIIDLIQESQHGNQDATMKLIKTFSPTLRKYARALEIEDAYQDLQLDFIEVIQSIRCDELNIRGTEPWSIISLAPSVTPTPGVSETSLQQKILPPPWKRHLTPPSIRTAPTLCRSTLI